jgi:hypothetical protein
MQGHEYRQIESPDVHSFETSSTLEIMVEGTSEVLR